MEAFLEMTCKYAYCFELLIQLMFFFWMSHFKRGVSLKLTKKMLLCTAQPTMNHLKASDFVN